MPTDVADQFSHIIVGAAGKKEAFLGVVQQRCNEMGIGLQLAASQRSKRDGGGVALKGDLKHGQGIEVFAEPIGPSLQVGYQLTTHEVGGMFADMGRFGQINAKRNQKQNKPNNVREVQGLVQAFQQMVMGPVIQELTDAIAQQSGSPTRNGFLGA